jgi:TolA-binding protein
MKGTERHRLKENEVSRVLGEASTRFTENRRTVGVITAVVVIVALGAAGYWAWKTRTETRAQLMLSDALAIVQSPIDAAKAANGAQAAGTYPTIAARADAASKKFAEVYNAYPSSAAGIAARYYAASAMAMLGRNAEAATQYQEVINRAGTKNFYGRMAQLGKIEAQLQAKQLDQALAAAQALAANTTDDSLPRDAVLMELGRVQAAAGKKVEAKQTFDKVVAEFPDSPYVEEAKQLVTTLT